MSGKLRLLLPVVLLMTLIALTPMAKAALVKIYSDSSDGYVRRDGAVTERIVVGDTSANAKVQGFVKFSLAGISGTLASARLYLYVYGSEIKGGQDLTSPFTNPGLGNCLVRHIADYGTLGTEDLDAPSIGNDPGVLLSDTATPDIGYVSIDVKAAMQDDINKGGAFSTFMIKMAMDTNNDGSSEDWYFYTVEADGTSKDPYVEFEIGPTTTSTITASTSRTTAAPSTTTTASTSSTQPSVLNIPISYDPLLVIGIVAVVAAVIVAAIFLMKRKPSYPAAQVMTPAPSYTTTSTPAATKYCINCGASIPEIAKHCPRCGAAQQ
jgi:hypothetical protein